MKDDEIIALYFRRDEDAIRQTELAYGGKLYNLSYRLLWNREDAEESVSDTYLSAWNSIPPTRPAFLAAFLAKITRHISLDRWRKNAAGKRGGGETAVALEELEECISGGSDPEAQLRAKELRGALNRFLDGLPQRERVLFVSRYWYLRSVKQMAEETGLSESSVKTQLFRTRGKLRRFLDKEGLL